MAGDSTGVAQPALVPAPEAMVSSPPSFEAVYEECFPFVWRSVKRMGVAESAVDDVCQEVFLVAYRRLPEFEGRSSIRTWVFGIVLNVVQVHRRTLHRKSPAHRATGELVDPDTLPADGGPHHQATLQQAARVAHEILEQLDEDKRAVFILAELEELPATEIAEAVGANIHTVYARLRAARAEFARAARRYRARDRKSVV
jgi:RNA polymerase sigma-70 factor, ECF subfamily